MPGFGRAPLLGPAGVRPAAALRFGASGASPYSFAYILVGSQPSPRGRNRFIWDGRNNLGARAPDGIYRIQVHLDRQHRTILLPNLVVLDTKPPAVLEAQPNRLQFSPDGDRVGARIL